LLISRPKKDFHFQETTMQITSSCDILIQLLRGEISAVETYNQAIEKFENKPTATELTRMRDDHIEAMTNLSKRVQAFGGEPVTGSGPWGNFAAAVTGTAKVIAPATALEALKIGEEHGVGQYEKALTNDDVNDECKDKIAARFVLSLGTTNRALASASL
jgi:hypothetical protein